MNILKKKYSKIHNSLIRAIKENVHGMRFQHMFGVIYIKKDPRNVIESGVLKGQSTWLMKTHDQTAKFYL